VYKKIVPVFGHLRNLVPDAIKVLETSPGNDAGLAIDNFSFWANIAAVVEASAFAPYAAKCIAIGALACGKKLGNITAGKSAQTCESPAQIAKKS